jgi:DNA-directed RNA polymerase subunit omega
LIPPGPSLCDAADRCQDVSGVIVIATIDELLSKVDSKYTLVHLSARRAREINAYYHQLGEGLHQFVRPLVDNVDSNKPLSIALEEIAQEKIVVQYPSDNRAEAEALLGSDLASEQAAALEVVPDVDDADA